MIEKIAFKNNLYPKFQSEGFSAQFIFPYAKRWCQGFGYDIGCGKEEWKLPNAKGIDLGFDDEWHAENLPDDKVDYIFSSHCLEHIDDWVGVLDYWTSKLTGDSPGTLFLYLPHYDQEYWRPWNNRKHTHAFTADTIKDYMESRGYVSIYSTGRDLNHSFAVVGELWP
jgi:hypothetical protein